MEKNPDSLEEILKVKDDKIAELERQNAALMDKNAELLAKIERLIHERYGRKSEKIPSEELPVLDEAVVTPEESAVIEEAEQEVSVAAYTRKQSKRKPIPPEFERETVEHDLPLAQQVCHCGSPLHCIGEEVHENLDYVPAKIKVIKHICKKYGCRNCETGITLASAPNAFIPKSLAAPGLLAHVILSKYEDHTPLYRQEHMWQRIGVELARSTLCNWILLAAQRLKILVDLQQEELLKLNYVRADETPVQVMEENKVRTSKRAYMWVFASGRIEQAIFVYQFAMTRAGTVAKDFFGEFKGFLQSDGFSGYNAVAQNDGVIRVGCMSHARRKFAAIVKMTKKPGAAHYATAVIAKLYRIEREIKEKKLNIEQVTQYRQQHAKPILLEFKDWLEKKKTQTPPKSPLGKAVFYCLEHWETLVVYVEYGFLDIDNNFTERRVKPFALGRKNWLFMGNERGGEAAAIFFSLIESAKANGLNTYAYLRYLMTVLPQIDHADTSSLLALLPHRIESDILKPYLC